MRNRRFELIEPRDFREPSGLRLERWEAGRRGSWLRFVWPALGMTAAAALEGVLAAQVGWVPVLMATLCGVLLAAVCVWVFCEWK